MPFALPTGQCVTTINIHRAIEDDPKFYLFVMDSMLRHICGDWGDLDDEDKESNEEALTIDARLLSAYNVPSSLIPEWAVGDTKIWIITEADRSSTTILWPSEY